MREEGKNPNARNTQQNRSRSCDCSTANPRMINSLPPERPQLSPDIITRLRITQMLITYSPKSPASSRCVCAGLVCLCSMFLYQTIKTTQCQNAPPSHIPLASGCSCVVSCSRLSSNGGHPSKMPPFSHVPLANGCSSVVSLSRICSNAESLPSAFCPEALGNTFCFTHHACFSWC
jgi:hypothetical protein